MSAPASASMSPPPPPPPLPLGAGVEGAPAAIWSGTDRKLASRGAEQINQPNCGSRANLNIWR